MNKLVKMIRSCLGQIKNANFLGIKKSIMYFQLVAKVA